MKKNFVDDRQVILVRGHNGMFPGPFNTIEDVLEEFNEQNIENEHLFEIHMWSMDEEETKDISEDLADVWVQQQIDAGDLIEDAYCPEFVKGSTAYNDYQYDISIGAIQVE